MSTLTPPLLPRNGRIIRVLGIAPFSTAQRNARSLAAQEALYRRWLDEHLDQPYELDMVAGRGSGERLEREDARRARAAVESGLFDLVIAKDLRRIFRRVHVVQIFCELCQDNETRLIAINDNVDTGHANWRVLTGFASMRHEMYYAVMRSRMRRARRRRFLDGGIA